MVLQPFNEGGKNSAKVIQNNFETIESETLSISGLQDKSTVVNLGAGSKVDDSNIVVQSDTSVNKIANSIVKRDASGKLVELETDNPVLNGETTGNAVTTTGEANKLVKTTATGGAILTGGLTAGGENSTHTFNGGKLFVTSQQISWNRNPVTGTPVDNTISGSAIVSLNLAEGSTLKFYTADGIAPVVENMTLFPTGTLALKGGLTAGGNIISDTNNTDDLGTSSVGWRYIYSNNALQIVSDERKKENFVNLNSIEILKIIEIMQDKIYYFNYKNDESKLIHLGVKAQELKRVLEENNIDVDITSFVNYNEENDVYVVGYGEFIPALISAVGDLSKKYNDLLKRIEVLETAINV